ncbi:uncharacterized protein EV420DRAFT_1481626 [Desarmillaria tabescens]|uniref:Uncharacterized protein n=1 Tax=Armillaria tabescens TaxID=1929756 RepID=A0AA39K674_ARMTA|nr:uncharacterized protein EV420DRAFT_1481626 [Desarmillaria tabescens]KAK0454185.1 hypothetical protein EV420DRAFT_1481626 [Desarmillaria tabescens]
MDRSLNIHRRTSTIPVPYNTEDSDALGQYILAELTLAPNAVTGNQQLKDLIFHIKQVFEHIHKANPVVPTFHDYHTVWSFTGTIHNDRERCAALAAAALAASTTPAEGTPGKAASVKPKASKAPVKRSHRIAKSCPTIEDSSEEEASVIAAAEEDTVMGNPDASGASQETDLVLFPSATIHRKADTMIAHFQQMAIDDEVEIVVNCDPTAGNIVEGHKVPLPKFLKNKKAAQKDKAECHPEVILLPYALVPGMDSLSHQYQLTEATIAKGKANKAAVQARKRPHAASEQAFKDSLFTIAADLAINNEASQGIIDVASALVGIGDHVNPSESVLRSWEADLRNDIVATTHKVEYLLKYHEFVVAHHGQVVKQLESHQGPVAMEADSAPVASGLQNN